jgi:parallel beta-helix repeat protein
VGSNGLAGITVDAATTVRGCTVDSNGNYGILALNGRSLIADNNCDANIYGIYVDASGGKNRVDGNNCTNNSSTGILINSNTNLIIRNSCSGNATNYSIPLNNCQGPFVNSNGAASTTSAWANFTY